MNAAGSTSLPPGGPETSPGSFGVADTLADLPIAAEDAAALAEVRLGPAVAAALRAALDWLTAAPGVARPLRARADDAALEIVIERIDGRWLRAAADALGAIGGSVGRVESARPAAPWVVRVPVQAERGHFLMVVESGVPIALPWPAVLHIVMARTDELERGLAAPRVPSPVPGVPDEGRARVAEVPVVLLGLGLKRGYFVADRLVWKLPAAVVETISPPPAAGLTHAVQTDEGDCYWVADPGWLLHTLEEPVVEVPPVEPLAPVMLGEADVRPVELGPGRVEAVAHAPAAPAHVVTPAPAAPAPVAAHVPAAPAPAATPAPAAPPAGGAARARPRAALVAEDSITASIFLARLLERRGFLVRTVESAAEMHRELARDDWALVCVDAELPDARGRAHLQAAREALERSAGASGPAVLVALVRDREDVAEAEAAGISRVLRKPFDQGALERLLDRTGLRAREHA